MNTVLSHFKIKRTADLRRALFLAACSLALAIILLTGWVVELKPLAGDEPHYLVVSHSLLSDGDLDLTDDYNTEKAWQHFYNGRLSPHYAPGLDGRYSTRAVGLSYYLLPFYALGSATEAIPFWTRLSMGILFALMMMQLYLLLRDLDIPAPHALLTCVVGIITIPLLFYSYSIFPEVPAALLTIIAVRLIIRWDERTLLNPLFAGFALALLPWLGVKYAVLSVVFGIGICIRIISSRAPLFRSLGYFALVPVLSIALLALFLWNIYGTVSPEAIYTGVGEGAKTTGGFNMQAYGEHTGNRIGSFFRVLLLYLFDQRDGLLFYSPFYLFGIVGMIIMAIGTKPLGKTMLAGFLVYWLAYAGSAWYSGYAPSARPLMAVIWILIAGCAYTWTHMKGAAAKLIAIATVAYSFAMAMIHLFNSHLMYNVIDAATQEHGNAFLTSVISPLDLSILFPNLVSPVDIHPIPVIVFISLAVAAGVIIWKAVRSTEKRQKGTIAIPAVLAAGVPILLLLTAAQFSVTIAPEEMQFDPEAEPHGVRLVFPDETTYGYEPVPLQGIRHHGFWQQGGTTSQVYIVAASPLQELVIHVHSRVPQTVRLQVREHFFELLFESPSWQTCTIPGDAALNWTNRALYPLRINCETGFTPADIDPQSSDSRNLGVRVAIASSP